MTDWNERSSRSHSVFRCVQLQSHSPFPLVSFLLPSLTPPFSLSLSLLHSRLVIESREKPPGGGEGGAWVSDDRPLGRTPSTKSRNNNAGKATRTSTLSLIDLAGSEKATSDKARSAEGKYINTSLLALKQVIATIAKNESKKEQ